MSIDISDIAQENHRYAIHLATFQNVIAYNNGTFKIIDASSEHTSYEAIDFWRNISLSAEILLKASLLKHHIPFFKKRAYGEYGEKVTATTNRWLDETLKRLEINYVAQINTGSVSMALKSAEKKLFCKLQLDTQKAKLILQMFYIIIRTRRNRNTHFYFSNQAYIEISEVEMLFLPLLNLLEEIYGLEFQQ
ncbi:MAG: hypothetical protein U9O83_05925 [Campylobacterota bacterium]|nr:hypothetical protein [Campylobacterota bacterium]